MENIRQEVIKIQRKINDLMDDAGHAAAALLRKEVQGLEDDLQVKKHALTIEARVKRIIDLLQGEAKAARIMNYEHLDMFRKYFEELRQTLRKMA
ncbi:MAG TPA: hypothetical protein VLG11_05645 [Candidatus Saccharimonadales bacterium]|nr:hypothetical protein [Candidatus Saccharimonadales bacterium]